MTAEKPTLPLGHEFLPAGDVPEARFGYCSFPDGCHQRGENLSWCHQPKAAHEPPSAAREPVTDHEFVPCAWNTSVCEHFEFGSRVMCGRPASEHRPIEQGASAPETEPQECRCTACLWPVSLYYGPYSDRTVKRDCPYCHCAPAHPPYKPKGEPSPPEPSAASAESIALADLLLTRLQLGAYEAPVAIEMIAQELDKRAADAMAERDKWWTSRGHSDGKGGCFYAAGPQASIEAIRADAVREERAKIAKKVCIHCSDNAPFKSRVGELLYHVIEAGHGYTYATCEASRLGILEADDHDE